MDRLRLAARVYVGFVEMLGMAAIAAISVVAVLQVFFRYVVGASLFWSEELMRYLMIWSAFGVAGIAYSRGEMMGFTLAVDSLPARLRWTAMLVTRAVIVVFLLVAAWYGVDFALRTGADRAIALRVSMFWVHLSVPVGCVLMALHVIASQFIKEADPSRLSVHEGSL